METAVITAAGAGSRLLPLTLGMRKEMLPLCARSSGGGLTLKPLLQIIFEQLYGVGIRKFCFVLRKGESLWKDYLSADDEYVKKLIKKGKPAEDIENLHRIIKDSNIDFAYQEEPKGFGDAVLKSEKFIKEDDFLVHAGDGYIMDGGDIVKKLMKLHTDMKAGAFLIAREVKDATRYGVIAGTKTHLFEEDLISVTDIVEKSPTPPSKEALIAVYSFNRCIFDSLQKIKPNARTGELELSDGIKDVLRAHDAYSLRLDQKRRPWVSVGSVEGYLKAFDAMRANPQG